MENKNENLEDLTKKEEALRPGLLARIFMSKYYSAALGLSSAGLAGTLLYQAQNGDESNYILAGMMGLVSGMAFFTAGVTHYLDKKQP